MSKSTKPAAAAIGLASDANAPTIEPKKTASRRRTGSPKLAASKPAKGASGTEKPVSAAERRRLAGAASVAKGAKPAAKEKPAKVVANAPALATPRVTKERADLARFVVATRNGRPVGSKDYAKPAASGVVAWSVVALAVEKKTKTRPTGSQLRRLYYLGGGARRA